MPADIKLLKAALEDAKFDDSEVREKIYACINHLSDDLTELNFGASMPTDAAFDDLEEYLDAKTATETKYAEDEDDEDEDEDEEDEEDEEEDEDIDILDDDEDDEE